MDFVWNCGPWNTLEFPLHSHLSQSSSLGDFGSIRPVLVSAIPTYYGGFRHCRASSIHAQTAPDPARRTTRRRATWTQVYSTVNLGPLWLSHEFVQMERWLSQFNPPFYPSKPSLHPLLYDRLLENPNCLFGLGVILDMAGANTGAGAYRAITILSRAARKQQKPILHPSFG